MSTQLFNFDGNDIRVHLDENGEPWFVAKDAATVLGYTNTRKAIIDHVDDEDKDGVTIRDSIGRDQKAVAINESGVYALIFGSKLPAAKSFKRWVTSEVLPTIRKTGKYDAFDPANVTDLLKANHDMLIQLNTKIVSLEEKVEEDAPKVAKYDHWFDTEETLNGRKVARLLKPFGISETEFFRFIREDLNWMEMYGTAAKVGPINQGFMENKVIWMPNGETTIQGRFTREGIARVMDRLGV